MNAEGRSTIQRAVASMGAEVVTDPEDLDVPFVSIKVMQAEFHYQLESFPADVLNALMDAGLLVPDGPTDVGYTELGLRGRRPYLQRIGVGDTVLTFRDVNARYVPPGACATR